MKQQGGAHFANNHVTIDKLMPDRNTLQSFVGKELFERLLGTFPRVLTREGSFYTVKRGINKRKRENKRSVYCSFA